MKTLPGSPGSEADKGALLQLLAAWGPPPRSAGVVHGSGARDTAIHGLKSKQQPQWGLEKVEDLGESTLK